MSENTKPAQIIVINGTEYTADNLTDQQKLLVSHVASLDNKISNAQFNLDQLQVGRQAFMEKLEASLAKQQDDIESPNGTL